MLQFNVMIKKMLKIFGLRTWCIKNFGYQIAHHGYLLTYCQGQLIEILVNRITYNIKQLKALLKKQFFTEK